MFTNSDYCFFTIRGITKFIDFSLLKYLAQGEAEKTVFFLLFSLIRNNKFARWIAVFFLLSRNRYIFFAN